MARLRSLPALFVLAALCFSCSGQTDNPTLEQVAKQFATSYCIKLEECMKPNVFKLVYPGGQTECASSSYRIHETDERSTCTQEQWDTCTRDLEDSTCTTSDGGVVRPTIPESCLLC